MKRYVFVLTYNESKMWLHNYPKEVVDQQFKSNDIHFIVLDNGSQEPMRQWCEEHGFTYYASEYNIGSSGGYNWIFKVALGMGLDTAMLMQADVEINNAEPLIITDNLTRAFGEESFFIWPQHLYNFWLPADQQEPWLEHRLHNLGNLVGFNPKALAQWDCYFDENYVVTHFDDVEFLLYLDNTAKMTYKNVPALLNHRDHFYSTDTGYPVPVENSFNIRGPNYHLKVHHSSMKIDQERGVINSHGPWYEYNLPVYNEFLKSGRSAYNPQRWVDRGYLPYPVHYEVARFFEQRPDLVRVDAKFWEIPNESI